MPRPFVPQRRPPESSVKAKRQGSLLQVRTWSLHSTAYKRGPRTMRAFAFYSPKVTGEQRNSFGSRAFSKTLNDCLLIGGFPGGVYTGLREFERYMAICGGMGGWNVFVLGSGSLEPGAEECAQLLSFPPSFQVSLELILGLISLILFQRLQVGIGL